MVKSVLKLLLKKTLVFIRTKLLDELGQKVPVGQNLKLFKSSSKPDQQGLSSSIRFEVMYLRTYRSSQNRKCASLKINGTPLQTKTESYWRIFLARSPLAGAFLDASLHLYKRVCPSVGPSVGPSVRPSVRP